MGYVQMETTPRVKLLNPTGLRLSARCFFPLLLFTVICFFAKENRMVLAISAFILLVLGLFCLAVMRWPIWKET